MLQQLRLSVNDVDINLVKKRYDDIIKGSTKIYYYNKGENITMLTHGPGSIDLTPRSLRANGQHITG